MHARLTGALAAIALALPAAAEDFPRTRAEYSADSVMETSGLKMTSKVWAAPEKERRETEMGGHKTVTITRLDKKVAWTLMPEQQMYMENKLGEAKDDKSAGLDDWDVERTPAGEEEVNGIRCRKDKVVMTSRKDGTKMGGFFYASIPDGIPMKVDAIAKDKGEAHRFKLELTNVKIEKQPAERFEVPPGYEKMEMPDMGGMMKGMMKGWKP